MPIHFFCPVCKQSLQQVNNDYQCTFCKKHYPTKEGILVFEKNIPSVTERYWEAVGFMNITEPYLMEFLPQKQFRCALDIGCGDGRGTSVIQAHADTVYGIDSSFKLLTGLNHKKFPNVRLINGDAKQLPFPDNFFDLAISLSVVEHIPFKDLHIVFTEVRRTLADGGLFLVRNDAWFYHVLEKLRIRPGQFGKKPDETHINMMTGKKFRKALQDAGFTIIAEDHFPFYRYQKKFRIKLPQWFNALFATHSNFVCKK